MKFKKLRRWLLKKIVGCDLISQMEEMNKKLEERINLLQNENILTKENFEKINENVPNIINVNTNFWNKTTYAQSGEDAICAHVLTYLGISVDKCTYIDLGANHARDMSNSYYFYKNGSRGVLLEANPNLIAELKFYRHEDIILNKCVSDISGDKIAFYIFNGDGLSTSNLQTAKECLQKDSHLKIIDEIEIETINVNDIIKIYLENAPVLLNIDIEGREMAILNSINFVKYRPRIIIIEMIKYQTKLVFDDKNQEILQFMKKKGYTEYAFTGINSIFIDKLEKFSYEN